MPKGAVPHYPLALVCSGTILRISRGKAIDAVVARSEVVGQSMLPSQAKQHIQAMVRRLRPHEFAHTREQIWLGRQPVLADIYGVRDRLGDWYLKLYMSGGAVMVASCHPPEHPLTRVDGLLLGRRRR